MVTQRRPWSKGQESVGGGFMVRRVLDKVTQRRADGKQQPSHPERANRPLGGGQVVAWAGWIYREAMKTKFRLVLGAVAAIALALSAMPAQAGHHHHHGSYSHHYYGGGGYHGRTYYGGRGYYGGGPYYGGYYRPAYYAPQPVYYAPRAAFYLPLPFIRIGFGG